MDLLLATLFLGLVWGLLFGARRVLTTSPETAWVHDGGFVQAVSLVGTCTLALGVLYLIRFMASFGTMLSLIAIAAVIALVVAVRMLLRRGRGTGPLAGGPAQPAV